MTKEEIAGKIKQLEVNIGELNKELYLLNKSYNTFDIQKYKDLLEGKYCKIKGNISNSYLYYFKIKEILEYFDKYEQIAYTGNTFYGSGNIEFERRHLSTIKNIEIITKEEFEKEKIQFLKNIQDKLNQL